MNVYHDESQSAGWFVFGLLWVYPEDVDAIVTDLVRVRARRGYWNEIHYADLSDYARKRDTARDWFRLATRRHCPRLWFNAFAVDCASPAYEGTRFDEDWQMYNRFAALALWSGYRRFGFGPLEIDYVSDRRTRTPDDNFPEYLPYRFRRDQVGNDRIFELVGTKLRWKPVDSMLKVRSVAVRKKRTPQEIDLDEELLQLCDLLLGASCQTLTAASTSRSREIKVELARRMMKVYRPPYGHSWFDHFTLSAFPDSNGEFYKTPPFKIDSRPGRQTQLGEDSP